MKLSNELKRPYLDFALSIYAFTQNVWQLLQVAHVPRERSFRPPHSDGTIKAKHMKKVSREYACSRWGTVSKAYAKLHCMLTSPTLDEKKINLELKKFQEQYHKSENHNQSFMRLGSALDKNSVIRSIEFLNDLRLINMRTHLYCQFVCSKIDTTIQSKTDEINEKITSLKKENEKFTSGKNEAQLKLKEDDEKSKKIHSVIKQVDDFIFYLKSAIDQCITSPKKVDIQTLKNICLERTDSFNNILDESNKIPLFRSNVLNFLKLDNKSDTNILYALKTSSEVLKMELEQTLQQQSPFLSQTISSAIANDSISKNTAQQKIIDLGYKNLTLNNEGKWSETDKQAALSDLNFEPIKDTIRNLSLALVQKVHFMLTRYLSEDSVPTHIRFHELPKLNIFTKINPPILNDQIKKLFQDFLTSGYQHSIINSPASAAVSPKAEHTVTYLNDMRTYYGFNCTSYLHDYTFLHYQEVIRIKEETRAKEARLQEAIKIEVIRNYKKSSSTYPLSLHEQFVEQLNSGAPHEAIINNYEAKARELMQHKGRFSQALNNIKNLNSGCGKGNQTLALNANQDEKNKLSSTCSKIPQAGNLQRTRSLISNETPDADTVSIASETSIVSLSPIELAPNNNPIGEIGLAIDCTVDDILNIIIPKYTTTHDHSLVQIGQTMRSFKCFNATTVKDYQPIIKAVVKKVQQAYAILGNLAANKIYDALTGKTETNSQARLKSCEEKLNKLLTHGAYSISH